ncbi:hypothetical protein C8J57DRAFT_1480642 [Mycena rebaudengoi]|nr:hypothetical protein C8J57DRAFT_1480642 [Mycena rebaudengoi]
MPPLTRQQTFGSVRSWWSDSNPNLHASPTINLHAAAKPLMKLLYNRQALEFISTIDGIPLSAKDAEIYGSYLVCEYVSVSTKSTILGDLSQRAQAEYDTLAGATLLNDIAGMLEAPGSLKWAYLKIFEIISCLALHESSAVAVAEGNLPNSLDKHLRFLATDRYLPSCDIIPILESLASYESTAMAVVRMLPLDLLGTLWHNSFEDTAPIDIFASWLEVLVTTRLLTAQHKATLEATSSSLVAVFCDSDIPQVVDGALWLLSRAPHIIFPSVTTGVSVEGKLLNHIADMLKAPNTAVAIVGANVLNFIEKLLRSRPTDLYQHIFSMLENLASHESTAMAILHMIPLELFSTRLCQGIENIPPIDGLAARWENLVTTKLLEAPRQATAEATCSSLVALLCDSHIPQVVEGILWLLYRTSHIKSLLLTKLLDHIVDMRKAPGTAKWRYPVIFQILSDLALHESRAVAIVEANILNSVEKLLRSRPTDLYKHIFPMLKRLVSCESTATAVLNMHLTSPLTFSIYPEFFKVIQCKSSEYPYSRHLTLSVIDLLACIARWQDGAEGVVATTALDNVLDGLHSLDLQIRLFTLMLLQELVGHESTVRTVVEIVPREDISVLTLSSGWSNDIPDCAAEILQILDVTLERINGSSPAQ